MGKIVYGYWDCECCGIKGIRGDKRECPGCGSPRDEHTEFYMQVDKREYVPENKVNRNPDWMCDFCDSLNSDSDSVCKSCGSVRSSSNKTYFDLRNEEVRVNELRAKAKQAVEDIRRNESEYFDEKDEYVDNGNPFKDEPEERKQLAKAQSANTSFGDKVSNIWGNFIGTAGKGARSVGRIFSTHWKKILIGLLLVALIGGLVYLFIPKEHEITVQQMEWNRSISIEKYTWVDDSGWSLPTGAKLQRTQEEVHSYVEVFSHYETKTRQVIVGYEDKVVGHRDLGNGQFEEIVQSVPVYGTEEYQEAVYRSQPVMKTKYYYKIQRWVHDHYIETSGSDYEPYWGEVILGVDERKGPSRETYKIVGLDEDDKMRDLTVSHDDYMKIEVGAIVKVKVTLGHAEIVFE